jgi:acetyltransferase-like isoleucine patch superfamily enzyme
MKSTRGAKLLRRLRHLPVGIGYYRGPRLMSALRRYWILFRNPHVELRFEGRVYLGPGFSLHAPHGGTLVVGPGVEFRRNFQLELGPGGRVVIGARTVFTRDSLLQISTSLEMGPDCVVGPSVSIFDGSHRFRDLDRPMLKQGYDFHPIRIGQGASIMSKCTVVSDIGQRAFIGANSVVTRPVPDYTLALGVPARAVEYFGPPELAPGDHARPAAQGTD